MNISRYNFSKVEKKWQLNWDKEKSFKSQIQQKKKILLPRNVSIPIRKNSYGTC